MPARSPLTPPRLRKRRQHRPMYITILSHPSPHRSLKRRLKRPEQSRKPPHNSQTTPLFNTQTCHKF
jgi:hypothetical protein